MLHSVSGLHLQYNIYWACTHCLLHKNYRPRPNIIIKSYFLIVIVNTNSVLLTSKIHSKEFVFRHPLYKL